MALIDTLGRFGTCIAMAALLAGCASEAGGSDPAADVGVSGAAGAEGADEPEPSSDDPNGEGGAEELSEPSDDDPDGAGGAENSASDDDPDGAGGAEELIGAGGQLVVPPDSPVEDPVLAALPAWLEPPPEHHEQTTANEVVQEGDWITHTCQTTVHDVQQNYDEILALGAAYSDLKPGLVLQGNSVRDGSMAPVPLPRSPIQISVDLAVENPTRTVENPTSANIQQAIAQLQREADGEIGNLPTVPAQVQFTMSTAQSFTEAALSVEVHASYSGFLASAGLDSSFDSYRSAEQHTVVAKLIQPMYTISISDDQLPTARSFFADHLRTEDFEEQQRLGTLGPDNLPTYVKSVTYGRIVIFTMTSTETESSDELAAAVRGSYMGFSGSTEVEARQREILSNSRVEILALGGSADVANEAIRTGNYSDFFGPASATTAVPLTYRINSLVGTRERALIGDATTYTTSDCNATDPCTERAYDDQTFLICNGAATYLEAAERCEALGMELLRLDDVDTDAYLQREAHLLGMTGYWIRAIETQWGWSWSRDTYEPVTYSAWIPGEPNNDNGNEDCVHVQPRRGWNDVPCTIQQPYVCGE